MLIMNVGHARVNNMDIKKLYSKWGKLEEVGITEQLLFDVFTNDESNFESNQMMCTKLPENLPDVPTYGLLIELYDFACEHSADLKLKVNHILKVLVDTLFPECSVSRADRLERRIKGLCDPLHSMSKDEQAVYLQKQWMLQPTGVLPKPN